MNKQQLILAIDDDINVLHGLARTLHNTGFNLVHTTDSKQAILLAEQNMPDVILLDINMPAANGYELCKQLRQSAKLKFTKIIFLSGQDSIYDRLEGYNAGGNDFIAKPFDKNELLAKLNVFAQLKYTQEINDLKQNLLTLFAHESKTPLTGIMGFASLLANSPNLTDEEKNYTSMILKSGDFLLKFVRKAQLLCQLKSTIKLQEMPVASSELVLTVANKIQPQADEKNVKLVMEEIEQKVINIDYELVSTALEYILENAVKFTKNNTTVSISCTADSKNLTISVADNGPGIAPEQLPRIFDEFYVNEVINHHRGQGLSLAIAQNIINLHSGTIRVTSKQQPDTGAVFSFSVPLATT